MRGVENISYLCRAKSALSVTSCRDRVIFTSYRGAPRLRAAVG